MRLAITADWLVVAGGAERVVSAMHALWPEAPIFTTVYKEGCLPSLTAGRSPLAAHVHTSSLQKWYTLLRDHRPLLPLMPRAVESWDLRGYDIILSSSHAVAKGCIPGSSARHICYCHTPMRYAWEMEERYLSDFHLHGPLRSLAKRELEKLRRWDLSTSKRVDLFIANSRTTQERIRKFYGRESAVLHPPVDERFFEKGARNPHEKVPGTFSYYLAVGRLVPYKRFDLLIEVANDLRLPLKIAGEGPDAVKLKRMAGETVELLGHVPDEALPALYSGATAFLYPTHEDAGIAVLEAQACGTPVIALGKGGALETIEEGKTGIFFGKQRPEDLRDALLRCEKITFDPAFIREHARKFGSSRFRRRLEEIVTSQCVVTR